MISIKNSIFSLMLVLGLPGCTLPDVIVRSESQKRSSQRAQNDGGQPPTQDRDTTPTTPDAAADASSQNAEPDAAAAAGTKPGASTAGSKAMGGRTAATGGNSGSASMNTAGASGCAEPSCSACSDDTDCSGGRCRNKRCVAGDAECQSAEDCEPRGPEYSGGLCENMLCLPNPRWRCKPPPTAADSDTRELTLPVLDALQLSPLSKVAILACNKLDLTCMEPIARATTDSDGQAKLVVPANFAGYMQQTERSDYSPAMYFAPLPNDGIFSNFPLIPASALNGLGLALGAPLNRERGHLMLIVEDCQGMALGGVTFTTPQADDKTTRFYVRDQIPTTSALDTPPEGDGGFVNMPPGVVEITATDKKTGLVLNTVSALVRAGSITTVYMRPAFRENPAGSTTP